MQGRILEADVNKRQCEKHVTVYRKLRPNAPIERTIVVNTTKLLPTPLCLAQSSLIAHNSITMT
jgi:hypothetical protein